MEWIDTSVKYTIDVKSKANAYDLLKLAKASFPNLDDEFCVDEISWSRDHGENLFNVQFVLDKRIVRDGDTSNDGKMAVINKIRDFLNNDLIIDHNVKVISTSANRNDLYTNEISWTY